MKRGYLFAILLIAYAAGMVMFAIAHSHGNPIAVLDPKGLIADRERELIIIATLLMLVVVIPVYVLTFAIAWRYREGNTQAAYTPNWDHNRALEVAWWAVPAVIITILGVIAWQSSHQLDPFAPIQSATKPITIQVVALQWKWLFIYPDQGIASVNLVQFPKQTPINFEITADAPMNSFWIPQLGGQIYAMPGMATQLHLIADQTGTFNGSSANISGKGFADMHFVAKATSQTDFKKWVASARASGGSLDLSSYTKLAQPGIVNSPTYYGTETPSLFNAIVVKFMSPTPVNPDLVSAN